MKNRKNKSKLTVARYELLTRAAVIAIETAMRDGMSARDVLAVVERELRRCLVKVRGELNKDRVRSELSVVRTALGSLDFLESLRG